MMGPAKRTPKPSQEGTTEVTFSESTWTRVILTNVGKFAGILVTVAISIWQFGQTVHHEIRQNSANIVEMRRIHDEDKKALLDQLSAYREWNKELSKDLKELNQTVSYMKGTIGIPRAASQQYNAPPSPSYKSGDSK